MPLSWGACPTENEEEHCIHFRFFRETVLSQNPDLDLSLFNGMGDRDKGMDGAANNELPMLFWTNCITHFTNNIGVQFKGCGQPIRVKVKTAAALYTKEDAAVILGEIRAENMAVYEYVQNAGLENLFRSYTQRARFDIVSNQAVESWNQVTKPWRALPRLIFFQKIEEKVAQYFSRRLTEIEKAKQEDGRPSALVPRIATQITSSLAEASHYEALQLSPTIFCVYSPGSASSWEVNLEDAHGKCTCGRMWEQWVTCVHAIVVIRKFHLNTISHFVHPCFTIASWESCYTIPLRAPNTNNFETRNVLAPVVRRVRGRPKGARAKSTREVEDTIQRVRRCRNCGVPGHRAVDCGGAPADRVVNFGGVHFDPHTGFLDI